MDDDPPDDEPDDEPLELPLGVRVAATVWIVYGGFWLLVAGVGVVAGMVGLLWKSPAVCCLVPGPVLGILGIMMYGVGRSVIRGHEPELRTPAYCSAVLGLFHVVPAGLIVSSVAADEGVAGLFEWDCFVPISLLWSTGSALLAAGFLALRDAAAYHRWADRQPRT